MNPVGKRTTKEKKMVFTIPSHVHRYPSSLGSPSVSALNLSPDHSFDAAPPLSFRCQTNGFSMLHQHVMVLKPCWRESGGHCMTLVMRYLLVSRVEKETNNDLKSLSIGSDRPNGLYNLMEQPGWLYATLTMLFRSLWCLPFSDILCCLGVIFAFKESDLRSANIRKITGFLIQLNPA